MKKTTIILLLLYIISQSSYASSKKLDTIISLNKENVTISTILDILNKRYRINFSFSKTFLPLEKKVNIKADKQPIRKILIRLFNGTGIRYTVIKDHVVLIFDPEKSTFNPENKQAEDIIISSNHDTATKTKSFIKQDISLDNTISKNWNKDTLYIQSKIVTLQPKSHSDLSRVEIDTVVKKSPFPDSIYHTPSIQYELFKLMGGLCYDFYFQQTGLNISLKKTISHGFSILPSITLFPEYQINKTTGNFQAEKNQWRGNLIICYNFFSAGRISCSLFGGYNYFSETIKTIQVIDAITLYGLKEKVIQKNEQTNISHGLNAGIMTMYRYQKIHFYIKYYHSVIGIRQSLLTTGCIFNFTKKH